MGPVAPSCADACQVQPRLSGSMILIEKDERLCPLLGVVHDIMRGAEFKQPM